MAIRLEVVEDDRKFAFGLGFSASPDRCIWACDGVGTFPIVYTNADASTAAIEEQVNKMIFRTQTPLPAAAELPIGVSIGNPVRVDKAKDHRAESTLRRAIQAPHGRAAQKNAPGQPGRYF